MKTRAHWYREGSRGRSLGSASGRSGTLLHAHVDCSRCSARGTVNLRAIPAPEQIDKKFTQQGWVLDPHLCARCQEKKSMTANPSSAAIKAQAKMFTLLASHFDADVGAYAEGWSDKKIATDTSLSAETVAAFRAEAFGDLKEPAEIRVLREDIAAARSLLDESTKTLRGEIDTLTRRLGDLSKRWAA